MHGCVFSPASPGAVLYAPSSATAKRGVTPPPRGQGTCPGVDLALCALQTFPLVFKYPHQQSPDLAARFLAQV